MKASKSQSKDVATEYDFVLAEVDKIIATTEARIEDQRRQTRVMAADFDAGIKAVAELDEITTALEKLKSYRAQLVGNKAELEHFRIP
jgi:outer membrane protein TolC